MKKNVRSQIFAGIVVTMIVAFGATVLPAVADSHGQSTGTFTLDNSQPTVTAVTLYNETELGTTTSMDPQIEYAVKIEVTDTNTLDDLEKISVVIEKEGYSGSDCVSDKATFNWTSSGGSGSWSMIGPGGTWNISVSDSKEPGDFGATSGTWWLHFRPGKVAREGNWNITATPTDNAGDGTAYTHSGLSMNWYGELAGVDSSFSFGSVALGTSNNAISSGDGDVDITAISNGAYELKSKTSASWTSANDVASVDTTGSPGVGEIYLADNKNNAVGTANAVPTAGYATIANYGSETYPTTDTGDAKAIYVWLSLASEGLRSETYSGTYYLQIADKT